MAHALHPNYTDKHDSLMAPAFQGGLVLKHNNNQRYATNAISAALFRYAQWADGFAQVQIVVLAVVLSEQCFTSSWVYVGMTLACL
jgi:aspartyl aminopeptidase